MHLSVDRLCRHLKTNTKMDGFRTAVKYEAPKGMMSRPLPGYYMPENDFRLDAERESRLRTARRIVVKVGTTTVTGSQGELCTERIEPIASSIARLMTAGRQVVLVSTGAIGLGR